MTRNPSLRQILNPFHRRRPGGYWKLKVIILTKDSSFRRPGSYSYLTAYSGNAPARLLLAALALVLLLTACGGTGLPVMAPANDAPGADTPAIPANTTPVASVTPAGQTQASGQPTPTPTTTIGVEPAALQNQQVILWHPWSGILGASFQALVNEFNQENEFGITVVASGQGTYNDLYDKMAGAIPSGDLPDLAVGYTYQILAWQAAGVPVADLAPYVSDPQWGFSQAEQADFYPLFWEHDVVDGVRVGWPAQRSAQLMYYNQDWARELGFTAPPNTPDEFQQQACAAARANNTDGDPTSNGAGGWLANTAPATLLSWMYAFGGEVVAPAGRGYRFDTPETRAALAFLKELSDSGCAWQGEGEGLASAPAEPEFATRRALFVTGSLLDLPHYHEAFAAAENPDQWVVIGFPAAGEQPVITTYGPSYALFATRPEAQLAAWIFLKWLASPENQARWVVASGSYPLRAAALDHLGEYATGHPHWAAALELLPYAHNEPQLRSWGLVRWAVSDVGTQIFRYYFTPDRLPATLELLDETAAELHQR